MAHFIKRHKFSAAALVAAFVVTGLTTASRAQEANRLQRHLQIKQMANIIIGITTKQDIIYNPNSYDNGNAPQLNDKYYGTWFFYELSPAPKALTNREVPQKAYTPSAVFVHIDQDGCHVNRFNSNQLARSKNIYAEEAKQDLDKTIKHYRAFPDDVYNLEDQPLPDPCKAQMSFLPDNQRIYLQTHALG